MNCFEAAGLTGRVGPDIDDAALGSVHLVLVRGGQLGFDHDGVLGPRLQRSDQVPRVICLLAVRGARGRINISDCPAVGAARVLSVKLCHIPVRTGTQRRGGERKRKISADKALPLDSDMTIKGSTYIELVWINFGKKKKHLRLFIENHEAKQIPEVWGPEGLPLQYDHIWGCLDHRELQQLGLT